MAVPAGLPYHVHTCKATVSHRYILSIQNSRPDGRLLEEALRQDSDDVGVQTLYSPESALEQLRNIRIALPSLILLAARFPSMSAVEFLRSCKSDPRLRRIPVLVTGTYLRTQEIEELFVEQASSVIEFPGQLLEFENVVRLIKAYWLGIAGLSKPGPECGESKPPARRA
jgi:response regulator RpfG family c-di-GMP phosphodiesterase